MGLDLQVGKQPDGIRSEMFTGCTYLESTKGPNERSFTGNGGLTKLARYDNLS